MSSSYSPEEVAASNERSLGTLARAITLAGGRRFSLILVRCNYTRLRDRVLRQIRQRLQAQMPPIQLEELILLPSAQQLYSEIQAAFGETAIAALTILGLEQVTKLDILVPATNQMRDKFRDKFQFPLVLWITDEVLTALVRQAPDFHSWAATPITFLQDTQELRTFLSDGVELLFNSLLGSNNRNFLDITTINLDLNETRRLELRAALRDLKERGEPLDPALEAGLQVVFGWEEYAKDNIEQAIAQYQSSLAYWQSSQNLERQGLLMFYQGLCHMRWADIDRERNTEHWRVAKTCFEQCLERFEQARRPDLVANFISQLGEVLQKLGEAGAPDAWIKLEALARKSQQLHRTYHNGAQLARDYGFMAEVSLQKQEWTLANQQAREALRTLANAPEDHRQHEGLYLLLLARAQRKQQPQAAIAVLEEAAEKIDPTLDPQLYINLLDELRGLYFDEKRYKDAFSTKKRLRSAAGRYGIRAFVGASPLQPQRQTRLALAQTDSQDEVAQEISTSGRQHDVERLIQRLAQKERMLTIIHGDSGVGKSSTVNAGLMPALQERGMIERRKVLTVPLRFYTEDWARALNQLLGERRQALQEGTTPPSASSTAINARLQQQRQVSHEQAIASILENLKAYDQQDLFTVIVFDQFEEFFFLYPDVRSRREFFQFLRQCLNIPSVHIVLSLREDYLHYLLECERLIYETNQTVDESNEHPNEIDILKDILCRSNRYELRNFSPDDARSIIQNLTKRSQFALEPELIEQLVSDLTNTQGEVRPIELQIVGAQLQEKRIRTLEQYRELGANPKETLVQDYLNEVVHDCGVENERAAELVLYLLTDENNTRPLKTRIELQTDLKRIASDLAIEADRLELVLDIFVESGLVFLLRDIAADRFQLVHDYLVSFIRRQQEPKLKELIAQLENERQGREDAERRREQAEQGNLILEDANRKAKRLVQRSLFFLAVTGLSALTLLWFANRQKQLADTAGEREFTSNRLMMGSMIQRRNAYETAEYAEYKVNDAVNAVKDLGGQAERAKQQAERAKQQAQENMQLADIARREAEEGRRRASEARAVANAAMTEAHTASTDAVKARQEADQARQAADQARQASEGYYLTASVGTALLAQGQETNNYQPAIEYFENATNRNDDNVIAWTFLGRAYASAGNTNKAMEVLGTAIARSNGRSIYAFVTRGIVQCNNMQPPRYKEAQADFEQAAQLDPENTYGSRYTIYSYLSRIHEAMGNTAEAIRYSEGALVLNPPPTERQELEERLTRLGRPHSSRLGAPESSPDDSNQSQAPNLRAPLVSASGFGNVPNAFSMGSNINAGQSQTGYGEPPQIASAVASSPPAAAATTATSESVQSSDTADLTDDEVGAIAPSPQVPLAPLPPSAPLVTFAEQEFFQNSQELRFFLPTPAESGINFAPPDAPFSDVDLRLEDSVDLPASGSLVLFNGSQLGIIGRSALPFISLPPSSWLISFPDPTSAIYSQNAVYSETQTSTSFDLLGFGGLPTPPQPSELSPAQATDAAVTQALTADLQQDPENVELLKQRADAYRQAGQHEAAIRDYSRVLELQPDADVAVYALRGDSYRELGRYPEALTDINRALGSQPDNAFMLRARGAIYGAQGKNPEAIADLTRSLALEPDNLFALFNRGESYRLLGQYDAAITDFNQALAVDPNSSPVLASRGAAFSSQGRYQDALSDFNRALEISPDYIFALSNRGEVYRSMGELPKALADLNRSLELAPDNAFALRIRGDVLRSLTRYDEALADLNRSMQLEHNVAFTYGTRGEVYRSLGRYDEAIADLTQALDLAPGYTFARAVRGDAYRNAGRYDEALADYNLALEQSPDDPFALRGRGDVLRFQGHYDDALTDLNRALQLDANNAFALGSRGDTYRSMGRYGEALDDLDRAIALEPGISFALGSRGNVYQSLDQPEKALADLNQAIQLTPDYIFALYSRGIVNRMLERYPESLADLSQVITLSGSALEWPYVMRSVTYFQMGRYGEALSDVQQALQQNPQNPTGLLMLGSILTQQRRYGDAIAPLTTAISQDSANSWLYYSRALAYLAGDQTGQGQADLTEAIRLAQAGYAESPQNWRNSLNLAIYSLAAGDTQTAEKVYRELLGQPVPVHILKEGMRDLQNYLTLFPNNGLARTILGQLSDRTNALNESSQAQSP